MSGDHGHPHSAAGESKGKLKIVLALTSCYLLAEVIGAVVTHSLALLAEAGHMLTDVSGLALALMAIKFAERPATPERTYGYYRVEILAALANAVVLMTLCVYILIEAYQRLRNPPVVAGKTVLVVAGFGLLVNVIGVWLLRKSSGGSLNVRSAYYEVFSDMLTAIGVIIAAVIMMTTHWYYADPLISAAIGLFILPRTWMLLKEAVGVLLEGTPSDVSLPALRAALGALPGVTGIHDLHVWTLTSGVNAMSAHVVTPDTSVHDVILTSVHECVTGDFKIEHVTVQVEEEGWKDCEAHL